MSFQTVAIRQRSWRRNQNTERFQSYEKKFGPVSNALMMAILICVLGLLYLTQVTKTSSYGYKINELTTKKAQLEDENRALQVEAARLQALDRVKNSDVAKNLVTPSGVTYTNP
ncbi:hypothetical protein DYH10_04105 [Candidatus Saccharibacteria bacterium CPR2]|nr:hypothetical protein [Candidatus Saccharibacteria bacterium CPR2]